MQKQAEELKTRMEQYEQDKLESEGKIKESNENLKKLLAQSKEEKAKLAQTVQSKVLYSQFAREAEKLGCIDLKMAYGAIDLNDIEVTNDLEFDQEKLKEKLSVLTREKSFLFQKNVNMPNDMIPGKGSSAKSLDKMTPEELKQRYQELQKNK